MRSTLLSLSLLIAAPLALAGVMMVGCGDSQATAAFDDGKTSSNGGSEPETPPNNFTSQPDSSLPAPIRKGSPLCAIDDNTCMPDDDGTKHSYGLQCATPKTDAGTTPIIDAGSSGGDDPAVMGCRLTPKDKENGDYAPACVAAGQGVDGASCEKGEECAPGFDCVAGEKSTGVCRRYCCSAVCDGYASQNGGPTFCDPQPLVPTTNKKSAPVCMPIKTCKLFAPSACATKETCAIVTDKGETGCVITGIAKVGESCDAEHCESSLTCLGTPGDRKCYQLCRTDKADCPANTRGEPQECATGSVFLDPAFGVCKATKK